MKIGFTGTRQGMTPAQRESLRSLLDGAGELHHGDCVGADAEAHELARELGMEVVIHPPKADTMRAWKPSDHICEPKAFLARNRDIVRDTEMLIATPSHETEQQHSGTWSTVRFARKLGRQVLVILPDGHLS
jgi:hypothetical protein